LLQNQEGKSSAPNGQAPKRVEFVPVI